MCDSKHDQSAYSWSWEIEDRGKGYHEKWFHLLLVKQLFDKLLENTLGEDLNCYLYSQL